NADNDELGRQRGAALELDTLAVDRCRGFLEMKYDAVLLVNRADEVAEFAPEYPLQRPVLWSHDMNLDVARAQRCGDLESDEACPDHDRAPRRLRLGDDGARIAERAQHVDVRLVGAGDIETDRFGAGCEQELVERQASPVRKRHLPRLRVDARDLGAKRNLDRLLVVELGRSE